MRSSLGSLSKTVQSVAQRLNQLESKQDAGKKRRRKVSAEIKVTQNFKINLML